MPSVHTLAEDIVRMFSACSYYFGGPPLFTPPQEEEPVFEDTASDTEASSEHVKPDDHVVAIPPVQSEMYE